MSNDDASRKIPSSAPPLSWPPPGMERLQGSLWRVIVLAWTGSLILVLPLLWALAVEQPFYSLGPFEDNWELGMAIAAVGAVFVVFAFFQLWIVLRGAGKAAELGYGVTTIFEVACDSGRDTGFLIQGKRHFGSLDAARQVSVARARIRGAFLLLGAAVWMVVGFGLAILLAARGFVTPSGMWLMTLGPTGLMGLAGGFFIVSQNTVVRELQTEWNAQEGMNRIHGESEAWNQALDRAGDAVALGSGDRGDARLPLQGVPTLVQNDDALRGLRWEYFATFNMLAPCINLHKMVFGPDETYAEWRRNAERSIVRTPGEQELFDLAESGVPGSGGQDLQGFLPRFLSLVLGSEGAPGSCASLIASLQS